MDDADVKINEGNSRYSDEGNRPEHGSDVMKKGFFCHCSYMLEKVSSLLIMLFY